MAKADLTVRENRDFRAEIGTALARAFALAGWSTLKEACNQIERATGTPRDHGQVSRWITGAERPQFDVLFSIPALQEPLLVALAALAKANVSTRIEFRRTA